MIEREWLDSSDPEVMLGRLRGQASARKLRLFACACCRQVWDLLGDERSRNAVETSERYADGSADAEELRLARLAAKDVLRAPAGIALQAARAALRAAAKDPVDADDTMFWYAVRVGTRAARTARPLGAEAGQAHLLRDIFGNPFQAALLERAWLTDPVLEQTRRIYQERRFDRLGKLADALAAAGCHDAALLDHCRRPERHVPGCWAIDALLGMS